MTTRPEETPVSTKPKVQANPGAKAPAASTPDTSPPPAPGGEVVAFPAPKAGPQHQTVMLHLMAGPMSRVHAWVEAGSHLGTYTTTVLPTFDQSNAEPGDGQRFVFHVPSSRRFISRPFDCEADARRAIANVLRTAEWVGLDLESPDPAELNRRVTAAQIKHPSRAQALKNALSFGVLPHALAEQDAAARGEAPATSSAAPAASPPPPPPPPPGGKGLTTAPAASPTPSPKRLEPTSFALGKGEPPPQAPTKPAKGKKNNPPARVVPTPAPSAKPQQRPSTIAPAATTSAPAASAKGGRVSAASAAKGRAVPAPTPPPPRTPVKLTAAPAASASASSSGPEELKAARAAPRTVKTSKFYPLTPTSQHPPYTPRPLDPKTPPAGQSAKARASGIPELGGWEQKGEGRYHLPSHQLDIVKVEGGWWWAKTGGPPISIGTGYPFGTPTLAHSCLQQRFLRALGWKKGSWETFAASKGLV